MQDPATLKMLNLPLETTSEAETRAFGEQLAKQLEPGDVVALHGDLGAGKTQLVKGACAALGIDPAAVSSPTFTIINEYHGGRLPVYHVDAYRVEDPAEFFEFGYEDYFFGTGVCFIEWPERVADLIPADALRLRLTHLGGDRRRISAA